MPRIALLFGHTAYIGGYLREVGRPSGPLTVLDTNGAVRRDFPDGAGLGFVAKARRGVYVEVAWR